MADIFSKEKRSEIMSHITGKNTKPELWVRKLLTQMGYRYRLHRNDLPGKPDIVFPGRKKVIFVNGCFWHGHNCKRAKLPETNIEFWKNKISINVTRDKNNSVLLKSMGWRVLVIWECEIKKTHMEKLINKIRDFLEDSVYKEPQEQNVCVAEQANEYSSDNACSG